MNSEVPVVHAVTTDEILDAPDFLDLASGVMGALGPRGAVHLRGYRQTGVRLHTLALALAIAQHRTGCWLVVNDRVDIAAAARARGAQLTSRSISVADARSISPRLAIGASVHEPGEGEAAQVSGADWVVAGHVFETTSHPGTPGRGLSFLSDLAGQLEIPVIAIGGILPEHIPLLRAAGARGVAAIRGIWENSDAEAAAREYLYAYDAHEPYGRGESLPDGER